MFPIQQYNLIEIHEGQRIKNKPERVNLSDLRWKCTALGGHQKSIPQTLNTLTSETVENGIKAISEPFYN